MEMAGINIFYIVPIMVFGPVVFFVLFKAIGIQTLFTLNDEQKELQRKSRALESALNIETAKSARYKKAKLTPAKIAARQCYMHHFYCLSDIFPAIRHINTLLKTRHR